MTIDTLIVLCAIAGGIWLVRLSVMVGLLVWRRRLRHGDAERPTAAETVSILIPARNEAANIRACLESLLNQDYPHIEIIVADDRSDDGTDRIVEQLAADRPRLRLLRIGELEDGWTGKTHALHKAAAEATGDVLLFTDADTLHSPDNVRRVLARMQRKGLDMASLLTAMITRSFWEHVLQPVMGGMLMVQFPLVLVNRKKGLAFSNGQYIMIRREAYETIGGHASVKHCLLEDVAMAREAKRHGLDVEVILGQHLTRVRMYTGFEQIWRGWSRIFYAGFQGSAPRLLLGILLIVWLGFFPWACLIAGLGMLAGGATQGAAPLTIVAACTLAIQHASLGSFFALAGCRVRYLVFYPVAAVVGIGVLTNALWTSLKGGSIRWRGTDYAAKNA